MSDGEVNSLEEFVRQLSVEQKRKLKSLVGSEDGEKPETPSNFIATTDVDEANARFSTSEEVRQAMYDGLLAEKGVENAKKMHKLHCNISVGKRGSGREENVQAERKVPGDMARRVEEPRHQGE